jgi:dihydrofolate reductase
MTGFWPTAGEDVPGAERMNNAVKIVFSRTLEKVEWGKWNNARLVKENIADEVSKLKQEPGKDMVIYGSATIVRTLMALGLIDEYQFLVHPLIIGSGKPLFRDFTKPIDLKLLRTESFKNGVVVLYYEPARRAS